MKSNLFINIGEESWKNNNFKTNKNTKFSSLINNKSLTTNASGTTQSTPQLTIDQNMMNNNEFTNKNKLKKSNSKISSLNIFTNYNINNKFDEYNINLFLPQIKTSRGTFEILKKADMILKIRHGKYKVRTLKQAKSNLLKKSNQINLNNYLIKKMTNKRKEINNLTKEINSKLKDAEFEFQSDLRKFLIFEENLNNKLKNLQREYNNERILSIKTENKHSELELITQHFETNIENETKQIILLHNYAKFIHKVFNFPSFLEEINQLNLKEKKYLNIYNKILLIFEKNKKTLEESNYLLNEYEEFTKRFQSFERKITANLQLKEKILEEINNMKIINNKLLEQIYFRKEDLEKEYKSLNEIISKTKEEINYLNLIKQNKLTDLKLCKDCISDLVNYFNLEKENNNQDGGEISISELPMVSKKILFILKDKEININEHIDTITNLIQGEGKEIMEKTIDERKRLNKKIKFKEHINDMNMKLEKRKFKVNKINRKFIFKGRKVYRDFPYKKKKDEKIKK